MAGMNEKNHETVNDIVFERTGGAGKYVGEAVKTRIVIVDQMMAAARGTCGVRLKALNPKLNLLTGLKCRVIFQ